MLEYIGTEFSDDYIIWAEDTLMVVALVRTANSYYFIKGFGYYRNIGPNRRPSSNINNKVCKPNPKRRGGFGHMNLLHFLLDMTKNNEFDRQLVYHELISIHHYLSLVIFTNRFSYTYEVLDTLINSNYLSERQKQRLIGIKTKIENKQKGIK